MGAQLGLVPGKYVHSVQTHLATDGGPKTRQQACQRRFARGRRPDDRQHLAGFQFKSNAFENLHRGPWRTGDQPLHHQSASGRRQGHAGRANRHGCQQLVEPAPGLPDIHHRLPLRHNLHQRRQHAPAQHRRNDHHGRAAVQLIAQHQPRPQAQQRGARRGLQKFGSRLKSAASVRGLRLQLQKLPLFRHPALVNVAQHAHGLNHLGVAQ